MVGGLIVRSGSGILSESLWGLADRGNMCEDLRKKIEICTLEASKDVLEIGELRVRSAGKARFLEIELVVRKSLTLSAWQTTAFLVEQGLLQNVDNVVEVRTRCKISDAEDRESILCTVVSSFGLLKYLKTDDLLSIFFQSQDPHIISRQTVPLAL